MVRSRTTLLTIVLVAAMGVWCGTAWSGPAGQAMWSAPKEGVVSVAQSWSQAAGSGAVEPLVSWRSGGGDRTGARVGQRAPGAGGNHRQPGAQATSAMGASAGLVPSLTTESPAVPVSGAGSSKQAPYQPALPPQAWDFLGPQAMRVNGRVDLGFTFDPALQGGRLSLQNASAEPFSVSFHGNVAGVTLDGQRVEPGRSYVVHSDVELQASAAVGVSIRAVGADTQVAVPEGRG